LASDISCIFVQHNYTKMLQDIMDTFPEETFLKADGFDNAIIGVQTTDPPRLVYSVKRVVSQLTGEGLSFEEAIEHFEYNIQGAYMGEQTPIWCYDMFDVVD